MYLHLLRFIVSREFWTMEVYVGVLTMSLQRVFKSRRDRLPSICPWTTRRSMDFWTSLGNFALQSISNSLSVGLGNL